MLELAAHRIENLRVSDPRPSRVVESCEIDAGRVRHLSPNISEGLAGPRAAGDLPTASLLFAPGNRPTVQQIRALAETHAAFAVSFDPLEDNASATPRPAADWLEVLANGLTFDLDGLAPGIAQPHLLAVHRYGLAPNFNGAAVEAISLRPGADLASAGRMLPVLRTLAWLTAVLSELPGVLAVGWHGARALSAPEHFRGTVMRWIEGGAFPGLGLTALAANHDGGMYTEGLAQFIGHELRLTPALAEDRTAGARLALRLIHRLVEQGGVGVPSGLTGPSGEPLALVPSDNGRYVTVTCR